MSGFFLLLNAGIRKIKKIGGWRTAKLRQEKDRLLDSGFKQ